MTQPVSQAAAGDQRPQPRRDGQKRLPQRQQIPPEGPLSRRDATTLPAVPTTADGIPRLVRLADQRLVAGVAAGVARHLGAPVGLVRAVFVVLGLLAGAGAVGYALLWIFVPQSTAPGGASGTSGDSGAVVSRRASAVERRQAIGIAAIGIAAGIVTLALGAGRWIGALAGPLVIVAIGAAFIWRDADDALRRRWRRTAVGWTRPRRAAWWRVAAGVVLVFGGLGVFAIAQVDVASARSAVVAVVLTLIGVAVIAVPWLAKLLRDLTDERRERIRETERAEVAAHLHDSVLQTLALIQRQPGDAREVQRLARAQERDLRAWLYGPGGYARRGDGEQPAAVGTDGAGVAQAAPVASSAARGESETCASALARAAAQVEDTYAVAIAPVVVGDVPLTDETSALVAAAREAMVNAAKHAGVDTISVYAELETPVASVYVRDRGHGFDPGAVPGDRRGVAESIRGRMERYGGRADVRTSPGSGTEWTLTMTIPRRGGDEEGS
jgi:signal transduction histidine kinase/phage shock protein PspC (stress-responsive transcriptional regulator)